MADARNSISTLLVGVAHQPKPRHVGSTSSTESDGKPRCRSRRVKHRREGGFNGVVRRTVVFDRRADDTRANWLGEDDCITWTGTCIPEDSIRVNRSGDGIPELDLGIVNRMASEKCHAVCRKDLKASGEYLFKDVERDALSRKGGN